MATIQQLIDQLQSLATDYGPDAQVMMAQPTHDFWHNVKVVPVGTIEMEAVKESSYHSAPVLVDPDGRGYEDNPGIELVLCIKQGRR